MSRERGGAGFLLLRLRLVTSQGPPYPSRSPRAHPSGWTRTQGLSRRDSHAPPSSGRPPSGCGTGRWLLRHSGAGRARLQRGGPRAACRRPSSAQDEPGRRRPVGPEAVAQAPARGRARRPAHVGARRAGPANLGRDALRELRRQTLRRRGVRALRLERQAAQDVHDVQGGPDLAQGRDGTRRTAAPSGESGIVEDPRRSFPRDKLGVYDL